MGRPSLSTHVLDTRLGRPAAGVAVSLYRLEGDRPVPHAEGRTDADGRISDLGGSLAAGAYRLAFDVGAYFRAQGERAGVFVRVTLDIEVTDDGRDYHVPLLVGPNACVSYRGS